MEKEDRETLKHISSTLDEMLVVMKKPENIIVKILEISAAAVTVLGIVHFIKEIF